jgi:hypothetical protein
MIDRKEWLDGLQVGDDVLHLGQTTKILGIQGKYNGLLYLVEGHPNWLHESFLDPIVTPSPFNPMAELYRLAIAQSKQWGQQKSIKSNYWVCNVQSNLYPLACKIAKVDSMSDNQILSTIFQDEDLTMLDEVVLNEFNFWRIAADYSISGSLLKAISNVRASNTYAFTARLDALSDNSLHRKDLVMLTAIGCLLCDFNADDYVLNPLFYTEDEWEGYKNAKS